MHDGPSVLDSWDSYDSKGNRNDEFSLVITHDVAR